ncbi:MAG TPA: response regulator transcription factor, partial [Candidatus Sulfotelmatobacter sp.]|nr:response regulator transcription factor [Candidatus Sulfotelmatobacter sp.]
LSQSHLERGLAYARRSADRWTEALALTELGHVAWRRGEYADARGLAQQGLEMFREIQDLWNVNFSGDYLGHVANSLKQYSTARRHFQESLAISKELNDLWGVAHSLANLGDLALDEQQQIAAEAYLVEAMERMREVGRPSALTAILEGFAALAAAQGEPQRAITLEAAAARVREELGFAWRLDLRTRVDRRLPTANESVGPAVVAKAERRGRAMNLESAVAYALEGVAARSGLKPPYEAHDAQPVLTRREVDIASLIAKGLSNRRIAERLFISQRTAETHVDRILTKLDFHSRAQIAVWAAQHGLLQNADQAAR